MNEATKYPLDFDALHKGSVISEEQLNSIFGFTMKHDQARWQLRRLALAGVIKNRLAESGEFVRVKCSKGTIRLLEDLEASYDASAARKQAIDRALRCQFDLVAVEASGFSDEEKKRHDRELNNGAKMVLALSGAGVRKARELTQPVRKELPGKF